MPPAYGSWVSRAGTANDNRSPKGFDKLYDEAMGAYLPALQSFIQGLVSCSTQLLAAINTAESEIYALPLSKSQRGQVRLSIAALRDNLVELAAGEYDGNDDAPATTTQEKVQDVKSCVGEFGQVTEHVHPLITANTNHLQAVNRICASASKQSHPPLLKPTLDYVQGTHTLLERFAADALSFLHKAETIVDHAPQTGPSR